MVITTGALGCTVSPPAGRFLHYVGDRGWGLPFPHQSENDQSHPLKVTLSPIGAPHRNLKTLCAYSAYFYKNWQIMTNKSHLRWKTLLTYPLEFLGGCHLPLPPIDQTPMENHSRSRAESWWSFRRQSPKLFCLFIVFKAIKRLRWHYIHGLRSCAGSQPTCFSWLIYQLLDKYNTTQKRITHPVANVVGQLVLWRDIYQSNITITQR